MLKNEPVSLILHGHFYQPPRENPSTGIIPLQESSSPYDNWNERVYRDCYEASSASRFLSEDGRILSITNNYKYMSFNFGPTLLSWLRKEHPETEALIIEADKESIKRLGHGNAIAQSYNHTILPLDKPSDAKLQIEWGARDFEWRFGRKAEGMWLPEAGINPTVIQLLADEGIKFVILSPHQVSAIEKNGTMVSVSATEVPYSESFILTGSNGGEVSAFFYHPGLAEAISFGHMLRDADKMYVKIKEIAEKDGVRMIHTATDGEIYGHHEPYGDMALAALIQKVHMNGDFVMDNYGSYLEKHPAALHAELKKGEDSMGTSWSCSHGVSRWYKDCGCETGGTEGWNQKWRTPLRNGLNNLAERVDGIFSSEITKMISPEAVSYMLSTMVDVFSSAITMSEYLENLHKKFSFDKSFDEKIAEMTDAVKSRYFSFTSCGFFFADIGGIEPRQCIRYAVHSLKIMQKYTADDLSIPLLSFLRNAHSNTGHQNDGMNIAEAEMQSIPGEVEAALYFFLRKTYHPSGNGKNSYGRFKLLSAETEEGGAYRAVIEDSVTLKTRSFSVLMLTPSLYGLNLYVSMADASSDSAPTGFKITEKSLPARMVRDLYSWMDLSLLEAAVNDVPRIRAGIDGFSVLIKSFGKMIPEKTIEENAAIAMKILRGLEEGRSIGEEWMKTFISMTEFLGIAGAKYRAEASSIISSLIDRISEKVTREGFESKYSDAITKIVARCNALGFTPDLKSSQNAFYPYYIGTAKSKLKKDVFDSLRECLNFK